MHGGKLLERIGVGGKAALGTFEALRRKLELVEEYIAELDWGIEVELVPRKLVAFALEARELFMVKVEQRRLGVAGIHQESGEHRIEVDARKSHAMTAHPPDVDFEVMARFGRDGRTEQGGSVEVLAQNEGGRLTLAL